MKQTVEEAANEYTDGKCEERGVPKKYRLHFDFDRQDIEYAFLAGAEWQAKQPWISVKERLPERNIIVLTKGAYGYLICYLSTLGEWETGVNVNEERLAITHWMPIPSFDQILESNKDVLLRMKEKGD